MKIESNQNKAEHALEPHNFQKLPAMPKLPKVSKVIRSYQKCHKRQKYQDLPDTQNKDPESIMEFNANGIAARWKDHSAATPQDQNRKQNSSQEAHSVPAAPTTPKQHIFESASTQKKGQKQVWDMRTSGKVLLMNP